MRLHTREFCRLFSEVFQPSGSVVEFGSRQYADDGVDGDLRQFFNNTYTGCDMLAGPGVDRIEDLNNLQFDDNSVGNVLCIETLEHVFHIQRAIDEIFRVLEPGGLFVVTTPFHFRIHGFPDDYWRITPSCMARLLEPWSIRMVGYQGTEKLPHMVMAVAIKAPAASAFQTRAKQLDARYRDWLKDQERKQGFAEKTKLWLSPFRRSKGERALLRETHQACFTIESDSDDARSRSGAA